MAEHKIVDGTGNGYNAKVDKSNRLRTRAVTLSNEAFVNLEEGRAYSINVQVTPSGSNVCVFYFKNLSTTENVVFEQIGTYTAANQVLEIYLKDTGTPTSGTTVAPTNLNSNSSSVLASTIESGNSIGGLAQGNLAYRIRVSADNSTNAFNFDQDIVVAPQQTFTVYAGVSGSALELFFDCHAISVGAN